MIVLTDKRGRFICIFILSYFIREDFLFLSERRGGMINVQGAPALYWSEEGVLDRLADFLKKEGFQHIFILHGKQSLLAVQDWMPDLSEFTVTFEHYQGECTLEEAERISLIVQKKQADLIIGIGGGKVMDLAKAVGYRVKKEVALIPTLASTCAAWTPLSVFYSKEGNFTHYSIFPKSTLLVMVEPNIIKNAPIPFLRAGIGDTLAKWYEAKSLIHRLKHLPVAVQVGLSAASLCKKNLLEQSEQAITDAVNAKLSDSLQAVIDTSILLGGMVGGYADSYGRVAGAHSIHNALTHIPSTHQLLHGEKVAYGILVQLALEKEFEEIATLLPFYNRVGLPSKLSDIRISSTDLKTIAEKALLPSESIHFMKDDYEESDIIKAISTLEKIQLEETERV
jgi:uncharacterized oxidoreductase